MSESPQSGHDGQAGGDEGRDRSLDSPQGETSGAESSGLEYPQAGYPPPMSPAPPAWPRPSGYEGGGGSSSASGGWGSGGVPYAGGAPSVPAGWGSGDGPSAPAGWGSAAPDSGGWRWDDASGGWRWGDASWGSGGWGWDDASAGWRWGDTSSGAGTGAGTGSGSGSWGWGDPPTGPGSWGGWNPPPGSAGGWGSGSWDSGNRRQRPPSPRRGARIITALLAAALIAAIAGAGIGHAAWRSADSPSRAGLQPSSGGTSGGSAPVGGSPSGGPSSNQPSSGGSPAGGSSGASGSTPGGSSGASSGANLRATPAETEAIGKAVAPALVDINTTLSYSQEQAAGTGIVLTSSGEILTNNHVINGETSIQVTDVGNGKTYEAKVLGYDHAQDVAVVQLVNAAGLATANIGNSSSLTIGQSVVAIGNAGGTGGEPSITGGLVTSLNQSITASDEGDGTSEQLNDLIQSNAAIQPGDSGGSLVNLSGQVIGVDTAASDGFSFQNGGQTTQGFSIPIDRAMTIARAIEDGQGSPSIHVGATAFLGVTVSNPGQGNAPSGSGATISQVIANGAAASAGLVAGDTITAFGGRTVSTSTDLTDIIESYHPGQTASVNYVDSGGQGHTVTVTLASGPPS